MTIWFATANTHKKTELQGILRGHSIKIPREEGLDFEVEETGSTFLENALIKARALFALVREPVIADDSGISVDALGGRPGIYSARYRGRNNGGPNTSGPNSGGEPLSDAGRNILLLEELGETQERAARFVCAMALMLSEDRFFAVQETLEGEIIREARGAGGFGYDPILFIPEKGCTVAELSLDEKNRLSHRAKAGLRIAALLTGF